MKANIYLTSRSRRQVLELYKVTSQRCLCIPETIPIIRLYYVNELTAILEIISIIRQRDVTALTTSLEARPKLRRTSQNLNSAKKTRQHDVDKFMKLDKLSESSKLAEKTCQYYVTNPSK